MDPFDGLHGVFADSLPDGWGRLLVDRFMKEQGINPYHMGNLERLAIVGNSGMGALTYEPAVKFEETILVSNYDKLAEECSRILTTEENSNLEQLFLLGGSSGGARPKILTKIKDEDWIIKFPSHYDSIDIGEHATMINGNGKNPEMSDILQVAENAGILKREAKKIAEEIYEKVSIMLKSK